MNDMEAIHNRKSIRNYNDMLIDPKIIDEIKSKIDNINNESNLNIELIENAGEYFGSFKITYGMFAGINSVLVLKGKKNDQDLLEKIGYYGERLVLDLTKHNLGTCWVGGTYDKDKMAKHINEDEQVVAIIPFGYAKEKEKLVTIAAMKKMHSNSKTRDDMNESKVEPIPEWFLDGIDAVVKAPSAVNEQLVKFEYDGKKAIIYTVSTRHTAMTDLGIAKLHFEIGAKGSFGLGNNAEFNKE